MRKNRIDEVQGKIDALDLEPIKFKFAKEHNCNQDQVAALEKWYKRFLFLTFKYKAQPIVVSEFIDEFWHQHILDTRKYAEDCTAIFGEFLHHFPYFGLRGDQDQAALQVAYRTSLQLMKDEFGETPDDDMRVFGTNSFDPVLPSLCSDCGNTWSDIVPLRQQRPTFSGLTV